MAPGGGKTYFIDAAVIWVALVVMWFVLLSVLREVVPLAADLVTRLVLAGSAVLAGVWATSALTALLLHLSRHRRDLYAADQSASSPPAGRGDLC